MARLRDTRGFTVVELLVMCAILGLALAAVTTVIERGMRQAYIGTHKTEVQSNARVALELMAREIRETTVPLTAATATSITFTHPDAGAVTYTIDANNNLTRNNAAVIGGLRNLLFQPQLSLFVYLDVNDNVLASPVGTPANVYRVTVTIQTGDDTGVATGLADARTELTTSVRLRNL
jgi:type II secretory pathway pseudopilin PulG